MSKLVRYEFWYDCVQPIYRDKSKLSCMDTDSSLVYMKTEDIYVDIAKMLKQDLTLEIMN